MSEKDFRFIDLGARNRYLIYGVYRAIACFVDRGERLSTIVFIYPANPYVCIGLISYPIWR